MGGASRARPSRVDGNSASRVRAICGELRRWRRRIAATGASGGMPEVLANITCLARKAADPTNDRDNSFRCAMSSAAIAVADSYAVPIGLSRSCEYLGSARFSTTPLLSERNAYGRLGSVSAPNAPTASPTAITLVIPNERRKSMLGASMTSPESHMVRVDNFASSEASRIASPRRSCASKLDFKPAAAYDATSRGRNVLTSESLLGNWAEMARNSSRSSSDERDNPLSSSGRSRTAIATVGGLR